MSTCADAMSLDGRPVVVPVWGELSDCKIEWKSLTSVAYKPGSGERCDPAGDRDVQDVKKKILAISLPDLLSMCCISSHAGCNEEEQHNMYCKMLQVATVSLQDHFEHKIGNDSTVQALEGVSANNGKVIVFNNVLQAWVEDSDILFIINAVFDEPKENLAELKKLALDLGFVLVSHLLNFSDPSFRFVAPITKWQHQLLLVLMKLLESFMVTTPPHFPFMPAQYFATIRWPVQVRESCSGKVHSIVSFAPQYAEGVSEGSAEHKDDSNGPRYCNYEVVNRRQPFKGLFSALQLYQLTQVLTESKIMAKNTLNDKDNSLHEKGAHSPVAQHASAEQCAEVLLILRNVFQRIATVDPALLHRDKTKSVVCKEAAHCHLCDQAVSSLLGRLNPFALLTGSGGGGNHNGGSGQGNCAASVASTETTSSTGSSLFGFLTATTTAQPAHGGTHNVNAAAATPARSNNTHNPVAKHHCRICLETVCAVCCAPEPWMNDRICSACYSVVLDMGLQDLRPRRRKNSIFGPREGAVKHSAETVPLPVQDQLLISILKGEPGEPVYSDEEGEMFVDQGDDGPGVISRCCSELMPSGLRNWRDNSLDDGY